MKKKLNTRGLLKKIDRLIGERMAEKDVVSIDSLRSKYQKKPASILVVEDDETVRMALRRILEREKHRVITAVDGTQLSSALGDEFIDLILLDVGLPWINGYELAELMKQDLYLKHIPIVFISAQSQEADIKKGFAVGANDYITKPFEVDEVVKTVNVLLELAD